MKGEQLELDLLTEQNIVKRCPRCGGLVLKFQDKKLNQIIIDYECINYGWDCMWKYRKKITEN